MKSWRILSLETQQEVSKGSLKQMWHKFKSAQASLKEVLQFRRVLNQAGEVMKSLNQAWTVF